MATLTVMTQAHLPPPSSSSSTPSPPRRKRTNSRLQAWHDGADKQQQQGRAKGSRKSRQGGVKKDPPPLIRKVGLAAQIYSIQGVMGTVVWFQGWREWLYPPNGGPDIVKAYECRPGMGVRYVVPSLAPIGSGANSSDDLARAQQHLLPQELRPDLPTNTTHDPHCTRRWLLRWYEP